MRKSLAIAALVAAGASATGAGAILTLIGSDTLFTVTQQAITAAGVSASIVYGGTGSGNGENAMAHSTQGIAPMSRFMAGNLCSPVPLAGLQTANGIVVGLDGVAVIGSQSSAGTATCNGTLTTCANEAVGAGYDVTVATQFSGNYKFSSWKDVLAVVYGGKSHSGYVDASPTTVSGCNSDIRNTIASHWGDLFEVPGCGASGVDGCTILQHAFRRDDGSGTSDVFAQLVGLSPSPAAAANSAFGTSPFCNVNEVGVASTVNNTNVSITINTTLPHGLVTGNTVVIVGVGKNIDSSLIVNQSVDATHTKNGNADADGRWVVTVTSATQFTIATDGTVSPDGTNDNGQVVGSYAMVLLPAPAKLSADAAGVADMIPTDYRELDPVRRPCANNGATQPLEDVCNRDGTLGLVVPVAVPDQLTQAVQYPGLSPSNFCTQVAEFKVARFTDPNSGTPVNLAHCPNGDPPHGGNKCFMPTDSTGNPVCLNTSAGGKKPGPAQIFNGNVAVNGLVPNQATALVYDAYLTNTSGGAYATDALARSIVGAWYRIHQRDVIAGSGFPTGGLAVNPGLPCTQVDSTLTLGCLAQASPCSIAYAGLEATNWNGASSANVAVKVNQIAAAPTCVQDFSYALSRKLYLDTVFGFAAAPTTSAETTLAQFEGNGATYATGMGTILANNHFVLFPSGGTPFCEDYNESMICPTQAGAVANTNACANNASPLPGATGSTICGNGIKESYEDCDDGTNAATGPSATYTPNTTAPGAPTATTAGNGKSGSQCSATCRWTGNPVGCDTAGTTDVGSAACGTVTAGTNCHTSAGFTPASTAGKCQGSCCLP